MEKQEAEKRITEVENRLAGVDFHKVICPITFIGDKITNSEDVNTLYIHPYASHNAMVSINNTKVGPKMNPDVASIYEVVTNRSKRNAISSYYNMNLYSLIYDTLVKFIQKAFQFQIDNKIVPEETIKDGSSPTVTTVEMYMNILSMDIEEELKDLYIHPTFYSKEITSFEDAVKIVSLNMSIVFSIVVDRIFNKAINKIVDHALKEYLFESMFDIVFYTCYNEKPDPSYKTNIQVMIQFVSGYLRQVMEEQLEMFRNGLDLMTFTIAGMITGKDTI